MELRADHIVASDNGGKRTAVVCLRHQVIGSGGFELVGMDKIGMQSIRTKRDILKQRMHLYQIQRVPAHVRNFQFRISRRYAVDFAGNPAEARGCLIFAPPLGHQLHTDADSEKRLSLFSYALLERINHAWDGIKAAPAIGKCTHTRQHDPLGARDGVGIAGDEDRLLVSALTRGTFKSLGGGVEIARTIIDNGNAHPRPPGSGNSPITSDDEGEPRRTGVEYVGSAELGFDRTSVPRVHHSP